MSASAYSLSMPNDVELEVAVDIQPRPTKKYVLYVGSHCIW